MPRPGGPGDAGLAGAGRSRKAGPVRATARKPHPPPDAIGQPVRGLSVSRPAFPFRIFALLTWLAIGPGSMAAQTLVVLSPHNEAIRREFARGFSEWHRERHGTPVEFDWRMVGGSSESLRFVQSEFTRKPDGIGIDVFFGGGQEPYLELAARQQAEPWEVSPEVLSGLAPDLAGIELRAPDFTWYGAAVSSFGILENRRVQSLAKLPRATRWEDLVNPRLKGWVGAGDPRGSGTMLVMFESFLQARGWDPGWRLLTQLAGNARRFDRLSSTTAKDAALGETAYALAIDFYALTQVAAAGRSNLAYVLPSDFATVSPDGIAILKGAPHRETARRFLEYVLSDAGQSLWMLPKGHPGGPVRFSIERMSVRPALFERYRGISNLETSPFDRPAGFRYDARLAQRRRGVVATLAGAVLVDVHEDLVKAWESVIRRGLQESDLVRLGAMPITAEEALVLAGEPWKDPRVRNARKTEWQGWARARYRELAAR